MVFDIKKFAIHDGPGLRTTVFFKGCPLHCLLCHNPESQPTGRELMHRAERCELCGDCVAVCPHQAISIDDDRVRIDRVRCELTAGCISECPNGAYEIVGREMTVEEVMDEVRRDVIFYDDSGGGVTFSGGEPLAQPGFLHALLAACIANGIHTALDTSGHADEGVLQSIAPLVDLFLYDLKMMDPLRHASFTGVPNRAILRNLEWLAGNEATVIVRFPLLPGVNDDSDNLNEMGAFISSLSHVFAVDILPYHRIGIDKYERLGRRHPMPELEPPSDEHVYEAAAQLAGFGLDVSVRGELQPAHPATIP